jgi:hypothetical protein
LDGNSINFNLFYLWERGPVGGEYMLRRQHGRHDDHFTGAFELNGAEDGAAEARLQRNFGHRAPELRNPSKRTETIEFQTERPGKSLNTQSMTAKNPSQN